MTTPVGRGRLRVGSGPKHVKRSCNCSPIRVDGVNTAKEIFVVSLLASIAWFSESYRHFILLTSNIRFNILLFEYDGRLDLCEALFIISGTVLIVRTSFVDDKVPSGGVFLG